MLNEQVLSTRARQYNEYQYCDTVSYQGSSVVVTHDTQNVLYSRSLLHVHANVMFLGWYDYVMHTKVSYNCYVH